MQKQPKMLQSKSSAQPSSTTTTVSSNAAARSRPREEDSGTSESTQEEQDNKRLKSEIDIHNANLAILREMSDHSKKMLSALQAQTEYLRRAQLSMHVDSVSQVLEHFKTIVQRRLDEVRNLQATFERRQELILHECISQNPRKKAQMEALMAQTKKALEVAKARAAVVAAQVEPKIEEKERELVALLEEQKRAALPVHPQFISGSHGFVAMPVAAGFSAGGAFGCGRPMMLHPNNMVMQMQPNMQLQPRMMHQAVPTVNYRPVVESDETDVSDVEENEDSDDGDDVGCGDDDDSDYFDDYGDVHNQEE